MQIYVTLQRNPPLETSPQVTTEVASVEPGNGQARIQTPALHVQARTRRVVGDPIMSLILRIIKQEISTPLIACVDSSQGKAECLHLAEPRVGPRGYSDAQST